MTTNVLLKFKPLISLASTLRTTVHYFFWILNF